MDADTIAACLLLPGSGDAVTVNVLQNNGRLSPALPFVMYEACPPGTFNHWNPTLGYFTCDPCLPLTYSDSVKTITSMRVFRWPFSRLCRLTPACAVPSVRVLRVPTRQLHARRYELPEL